MTTKVYGASDDLIECDGDVTGEVNWVPRDDAQSALVMFSDGTLLRVKYGKDDLAVWEILPIQRGSLFDRIELCLNDDADPYSDIVHFKDGLQWAYAATGTWERVR